jgi:hypothetical protein
MNDDLITFKDCPICGVAKLLDALRRIANEAESEWEAAAIAQSALEFAKNWENIKWDQWQQLQRENNFLQSVIYSCIDTLDILAAQHPKAKLAADHARAALAAVEKE